MVVQTATLRLVHESSGVLFLNKSPGVSFHRSVEHGQDDVGVLPMLREMQRTGALEHTGALHAVHRLDRVTSGLFMVAKHAEAARELSNLLRERRIHKYYVAISARKPSKKQGVLFARSWLLTG